jgi:hypothetical protein
MDQLKQYTNITENTETLFSIIIYDTSSDIVIKFIENEINKAKNITNVIKKNKINNRLFMFLKHIQENYCEEEKEIINKIFLISDNIINYKLNNNEINTARTYNLHKIFIKCECKFCIDYIIDFFTNFNFIYVMKVNKNELFIIQLNKNKEKELEKIKISGEQKILEEIEKIRKNNNYKDFIIILGKFSITNLTNLNIIIHKELLNKSEVYELYENELMKKNHNMLSNRISDMKNENTNLDLYIFGKLKFEIKEAIESYIIKELYIEDKKLEKLRSFVDGSFLNFKIIEIKSLENGDIADQFIKDYNGIMGIKYY